MTKIDGFESSLLFRTFIIWKVWTGRILTKCIYTYESSAPSHDFCRQRVVCLVVCNKVNVSVIKRNVCSELSINDSGRWLERDIGYSLNASYVYNLYSTFSRAISFSCKMLSYCGKMVTVYTEIVCSLGSALIALTWPATTFNLLGVFLGKKWKIKREFWLANFRPIHGKQCL